jgi:hypothetical protein
MPNITATPTPSTINSAPFEQIKPACMPHGATSAPALDCFERSPKTSRVFDLSAKPVTLDQILGINWREQILRGEITVTELEDTSKYYLRAGDNRGAFVRAAETEVEIALPKVSISNQLLNMHHEITLDDGATLTILAAPRDEGTELIEQFYAPAVDRALKARDEFIESCVENGGSSADCEAKAALAASGISSEE